jgi:hypothetical protein
MELTIEVLNNNTLDLLHVTCEENKNILTHFQLLEIPNSSVY